VEERRSGGVGIRVESRGASGVGYTDGKSERVYPCSWLLAAAAAAAAAGGKKDRTHSTPKCVKAKHKSNGEHDQKCRLSSDDRRSSVIIKSKKINYIICNKQQTTTSQNKKI